MKGPALFAAFLIAGSAAAYWLAGVWPWSTRYEVSRVRTISPPAAPELIRVLGYVEPVSDIRKLAFKADGVIETCRVQVGQLVEAGDVLAVLRDRDEQATVTVAEQELAVAAAERDKLLSGAHPQQIEAAERRLAKLEERVRYAQLQFDRQAKLYERNIVTEEEYDRAKTNLHQGREELNEFAADLNELKTRVRPVDRALAEARVKLAAASLLAAQEHLQNTVLKAPIRGTVLEIMKREGEAVRAFDPQPVMVFADLSELRVRAEVDERYVHLIRTGQQAVIYGRGLGDQRCSARLVLMKQMMGNKTVFSRDSGERKDLDVVQVFARPDEELHVPVGLQVDLDIQLHEAAPEPYTRPAAAVADR